MNSRRTEGVRNVPAWKIEKWGKERGITFPADFVEFFAEFGGVSPKEEWGYQFIAEDRDDLDFADIRYFHHFDERISRHSVNEDYKNHFLEWNQPFLIPFTRSDISAHAVLDFRKSCSNPAVYNVDVFCSSRSDPDRLNMTWLADSFAEFLDILEPLEDFEARNPERFQF